MTDERAQKVIDKAMKSGSLQQRNVVGVITGLMGSGKTTLLHHLFGEAPPNLYSSTGVSEQSFRGLLHHIVQFSVDTWKRLSYGDIRGFLAPLIRAGMDEAQVDSLAHLLMQSIDPSYKDELPSSSDLEGSNTSFKGSHTGKEMIPLVKEATVTGPLQNLVLELIHMIDTGGQPELMEVLPSLIHNAEITIVVVNLEYGLNEHPDIYYHEEEKCFQRILSSQYTGRDIIMKLASTLQGKKSQHENFRLLIVATHRDCVKDDLDTRVKALNKELHSLLPPTFKQELILYESPDKIAYVLNLKDPDINDKAVLELIRTEIGKQGLGMTLDTPTSFFVFEQDLIHFAENEAKCHVLSLRECRKVGARLGMNHEMVEAALVLLHRQNTFLYFRHILPNHVFVKPQVLLDIVNSIVQFSYKTLQSIPAKFVAMLKDGIITGELLSYGQISHHFRKEFYEVQDAIKLLCHTFTLAPLQPAEKATEVDGEKKEYLMMCLKPAICIQELNNYIPISTDTVPLVIKFSNGCVPLGCFGSTISCLLSKYNWEVHRKEDGSPKCLAHNIASLYDPDLLLDVVLVDRTQYIEVHTDCDLHHYDLPPNTYSQLHTTIFGAIEKVFNIMHLCVDHVKISPAVVCHCQKVKNEHYATFEKRRGKYFLRCSQSTTLPNKKHMLWMGDDTANSIPTLPQLMRLKIPEKIGAHYTKFGTLLLKDDKGCIIPSIAQACFFQCDEIVTRIFRTWFDKQPTPVTWESLIKILEDSELKPLANFVQKCHREQLFC